MTRHHRTFNLRKPIRSIAAAIALAVSGGYAIADSGSSSSANAATVGKVIPFDRGQPSPATPVGLLSDGEYNVHIIGVNWPHHVFVSTSFKVVGAE